MRYIPYSHQTIDSSDIREAARALRAECITRSARVEEFEQALCKYTGAKHAVVVSSGTAALHIACLAAGIKKGDQAITSPITFVASANCVLYCGGRPVFADIQEDTINIDPENIERKLNKKTRAIIPVHFSGHPCDMEEIYKIAKKRNLLVIEDAAHALGAQYKHRGRWIDVGSCRHSDMAIFSFHPAKHITTGEGGAVLTNNKKIYEKLVTLRGHGITKDKRKFIKTKISNSDRGQWYYQMQRVGYNYFITDIQCALGISQLKKADDFLKRRRAIVKRYKNSFDGNQWFDLPPERDYVKSSWHLYAIRLKKAGARRPAFEYLQKQGIGAQVHYIPVYWHPYFQQLGYKKGSCPRAEEFYKRTISIPIYPKMRNKDIEYVSSKIMRFAS